VSLLVAATAEKATAAAPSARSSDNRNVRILARSRRTAEP
jgi:hypothetical protein